MFQSQFLFSGERPEQNSFVVEPWSVRDFDNSFRPPYREKIETVVAAFFIDRWHFFEQIVPEAL